MFGNRIRVAVVAFSLLCLFPGQLIADSRSIVGFVDLSQVVRAYFRESFTVREIEGLYQRLEQVDAELEFELAQLQDAMAEIPFADSDARSDLRDEMADLREAADAQSESIRRQIALKQNVLLGSEGFALELSDALNDVATSGGFAMVLPIQDDDAFWYNPDNVVTQDVIDQLVWLRDRRLE
jgi:Skp family chaperone for outer membrane proteins